MNELIVEMNRILAGWKEFFPVKTLDLEFKTDDAGTVFLADKAFSPEPDLKFKSVQYDAEHICFCFDRNRKLHIEFEWPEDKLPTVRSLSYCGSPVS